MPFRLLPSQMLQVALGVLALAAPAFVGPYWTHVGALAWYYALLASSWALLAGFAGQFSFAHLGFAALGGYASALLTARAGLPPVLAMPAAILLAMAVSAAIGVLVLRLSGPYLALFTLAISEIFRLILVAEIDLTRGSLGLQVPRPIPGDSDVPYYYLGFALVLLALLGSTLLLRSRAGLFLRAIREDEHAAQANGVNTTLYKIIVFVVTGGIAAIAGIYQGIFIGILTPNLMIIPEMGLVIAMAVIGGIESLAGSILGAVVVFALSELLRDLGEWRFVLLGLALIVVQRFAQNGLYPLVERLIDGRAKAPALAIQNPAPVSTSTAESDRGQRN
jgi:branched-chain amino acid transport system permease protein